MGESDFHAGQLHFDRRNLRSSAIPPNPLKRGARGDKSLS
jgi:hypothetical protein